MDLSMELGVDFMKQIDAAVGSCRVLVAVVGPSWATIEDARGARRLDDPADFIRVEIEAGLRQADVRVVPVLVQGATMPSADALPGPLADFARRHALELSDARWRYDVDRLVSTAERLLESGESAGPERGKRRERRAARDVAPEHAHDRAGPATAGDSRRRAAAGWLQSHRRLAAVALVAVLIGLGALVIASGGGNGGSPKSLSEVIPASLQNKCEQATDFWMRDHGAVEQRECELGDAGITYGRFRSLGAAQKFVQSDSNAGVDKGSECPDGISERLEAQYEGGEARCYKTDRAVVINWSDRADPVGVQLYVEGLSVDETVDERAKVL
jgi:hypothetical protein